MEEIMNYKRLNWNRLRILTFLLVASASLVAFGQSELNRSTDIANAKIVVFQPQKKIMANAEAYPARKLRKASW